MDNGWQSSADAWVADMGEPGDFGRRYVLDPVMLPRALAGSPRNALDVGCGEGRFCRMLKSHGVDAVGIDPTPALIAVGTQLAMPAGRMSKRQPSGCRFASGTFDLVVSYLSLIDIPDIEAAIPEMARVLRPGGTLADRQSHELQHRVRGRGLGQGRRRPAPLLSDRQLPAGARDVDRVSRHSQSSTTIGP